MEEIKCDARLCAVCGHDCAHGRGNEVIEDKPVSVEDMALRREERAARIAELAAEQCLPVVSFTMNVAGPQKYSEAAEVCFNAGLKAFEDALSRFNAVRVHEEYHIAHTGCEAMFVYSGLNARLVKAVAMKTEEELGFSRLFDIDVIDKNGVKLERAKPRKCLICGKNAMECARSRAHSLEELTAATEKLTREAIAYSASVTAYEALVSEVVTTPKAGLVDQNNNGANSDMDVPLFVKSAQTLAPYYYSMAYTAADTSVPASGHGEGCTADEALNCADCPSHEGCTLDHGASLMTKLTILGVEAEAKMKQATGGVNTHKGAIFCLGLIASAWAKLIAGNRPHSVPEILEEAKHMALSRPDPGRGTNGAAVRESFPQEAKNALGADAEARAGFTAAANAYRRILGFRLMGLSENDCYALALIGIMAELYDTNAYKRGGEEGARYVRTRAKEILSMPLSKRLSEVEVFDKELIERNVNCGGAADMLAAAIFLDKLGIYNERRRTEEELHGAHTHEHE